MAIRHGEYDYLLPTFAGEALVLGTWLVAGHGKQPGLDILMKRADRALYAAKAAGRNRVERWHPVLDGDSHSTHRNRATSP